MSVQGSGAGGVTAPKSSQLHRLPELPSSVNPVDLLDELTGYNFDAVPEGSGRARGEGTTDGWITGLANWHFGPVDLDPHSFLWEAVGELVDQAGEPFVRGMVNRLEAGGMLDVHRDGGPFYHRWHLPLLTGPKVEWWDEINGACKMRPGSWYLVRYDILHSVRNGSGAMRVHLVVDIGEGQNAGEVAG